MHNNLPNGKNYQSQAHTTVCFPFGFCSVQDETAKKGMFGFPIDNTIGGTSQPNGWMDNWVDFYRERRLQHQLKLTKDPKLQHMGKKLCDNLEHFFQGVDVSFLRPLQQHSAHFASLRCILQINWSALLLAAMTDIHHRVCSTA